MFERSFVKKLAQLLAIIASTLGLRLQKAPKNSFFAKSFIFLGIDE